MAVRNITKQLAGAEDLLLGNGSEQQVRNGNTRSITKIDIPAIVDSVDDLANIDKTKYRTAIVRDENRGGTFHYDSSKVGENDGGVVFNGWVRQYEGAVNVKWFGDTSLEQTFLNAANAVNNNSVYVPEGTYNLDGDTIDFTSKKFHSFGSVIINGNTTLTVIDIHNIDADTLDGKNSGDFAQLEEDNIFTGSIIRMTNLPTSDPSVEGQLWNDNGTVKVSAG